MSYPPTYLQEIESLNLEISKSHPTDILQFCSNYFAKRLETQRAEFLLSSPATLSSKMSGHTFPGRLGTNANPFGGEAPAEQVGSGAIGKVVEEDENDTMTSPTAPNFGSTIFGSSFGGDASGEGPPSSFKSEGFPEHYGLGRRTSVSAESLNPTASSNDNWTPPYHQKTEEQSARLKKSISGNFLFSHLDDEQSEQVLGALVEKPIPAKGIKVRGASHTTVFLPLTRPPGYFPGRPRRLFLRR